MRISQGGQRPARGRGTRAAAAGPGGGYPGSGTGWRRSTPAARDAPAAASASRVSAASAFRASAAGAGAATAAAAPSPYEGTVRWESARPILEAMKSPLPEAFEGRYVICVSGIPLLGGRSMGAGEEDDSTASRAARAGRYGPSQGLSSLEAKGRDPVQADLVTRQVGTGSSFLFGFSRKLLPLETRDTDFLFTTTLGRLVVKAHFVPKEMLYHGELAV